VSVGETNSTTVVLDPASGYSRRTVLVTYESSSDGGSSPASFCTAEEDVENTAGDVDEDDEDTDADESSSNEEEIADSPASPEVLPITDLGETAPSAGVESATTAAVVSGETIIESPVISLPTSVLVEPVDDNVETILEGDQDDVAAAAVDTIVVDSADRDDASGNLPVDVPVAPFLVQPTTLPVGDAIVAPVVAPAVPVLQQTDAVPQCEKVLVLPGKDISELTML
jgi:hypothetical protein